MTPASSSVAATTGSGSAGGSDAAGGTGGDAALSGPHRSEALVADLHERALRGRGRRRPVREGERVDGVDQPSGGSMLVGPVEPFAGEAFVADGVADPSGGRHAPPMLAAGGSGSVTPGAARGRPGTPTGAKNHDSIV